MNSSVCHPNNKEANTKQLIFAEIYFFTLGANNKQTKTNNSEQQKPDNRKRVQSINGPAVFMSLDPTCTPSLSHLSSAHHPTNLPRNNDGFILDHANDTLIALRHVSSRMPNADVVHVHAKDARQGRGLQQCNGKLILDLVTSAGMGDRLMEVTMLEPDIAHLHAKEGAATFCNAMVGSCRVLSQALALEIELVNMSKLETEIAHFHAEVARQGNKLLQFHDTLISGLVTIAAMRTSYRVFSQALP